MASAHELGFEVVVVYIGTSNPDINVARVAQRVKAGGHDVPELDIRRRYERSLSNLPLALSRSDYALLLDNSSERGYEPVAMFDHGKADGSALHPSGPLSSQDSKGKSSYSILHIALITIFNQHR
jgi:predicted ABC-type ATPase